MSYYWDCIHTHAPSFIVFNIVLHDDCTLKNKHFILLFDAITCYPENKTRIPEGHPQNLGSHIKRGTKL